MSRKSTKVKSQTNSINPAILTYENLPEGGKKVFDAAVEEFATQGFARTSTANIARNAGVSEALIFKYFSNKINLFKQIIFPFILKIILPRAIERVHGVIAKEYVSFEDFLRELLNERVDFVRSHRKFIQILLQELPVNTELQTEMTKAAMGTVIPEIIARLKAFQKSGEIIEGDINVIFRYCSSIIAGILGRRVFTEVPLEQDAPDIDFAVAAINRSIGISPVTSKRKSNKSKTGKTSKTRKKQ